MHTASDYIHMISNGISPRMVNSSPNRKTRRMWASNSFQAMVQQARTGLSIHRREIALDNGDLIHPTKGYGSAYRRTVAPTSLRKKD